MIKVFNGNWRGIGDKEPEFWMRLEFGFRDYLHFFKGAKLAVFMAIVLHSDEDGIAFPSYDYMEQETGYGRDTIGRALNELCKLKIQGKRVLERYRIRDENGHLVGSNRYLIFPSEQDLIYHSPILPTLEKTNSGKSVLEVRTINKEITNNKEVTSNEALKKNKIYFLALVPEDLHHESFFPVWQEWCDYRKEKRKTLTEKTAQRQLKKLLEHGLDAAVWALEESMTQGWQGLFPENYRTNTKGQVSRPTYEHEPKTFHQMTVDHNRSVIREFIEEEISDVTKE